MVFPVVTITLYTMTAVVVDHILGLLYTGVVAGVYLNDSAVVHQ